MDIKRSGVTTDLSVGDALLDLDRAPHRVDSACELDQGTIADELDYPTAVLGGPGLDQCLAHSLEPGVRAGPVLAHQPMYPTRRRRGSRRACVRIPPRPWHCLLSVPCDSTVVLRRGRVNQHEQDRVVEHIGAAFHRPPPGQRTSASGPRPAYRGLPIAGPLYSLQRSPDTRTSGPSWVLGPKSCGKPVPAETADSAISRSLPAAPCNMIGRLWL